MSDAYIEYTHRFFRKWLPVYDGFALTIFWTYRALTRIAEPAAGRTVLDLCTGTGEVALRLARRGARVIGIDVTPDMLDKARAKASKRRDLDVDFRLGDARHLDLADRSVDAVTLSLALHDMPRAVRVEVLLEALRVTRDRLVILDYHMGSGVLGRAMAKAITLFESAYFPRFAREGLEPLLDDLGLERVESRWQFPCFKIWVIRRDRARAAALDAARSRREGDPA